MLKRVIEQIAVLVLLLGIWEAAAWSPKVRFLIGAPSLVLHHLFLASVDGSLLIHAGVTGGEALVGFVIGVLSGTLAGFMLWYSPRVAAFAKPYIFILSILPPFAFAPVIIIWFGIGFGMKAAIAALATFLVSLSQAYEGCRAIDPQLFDLLRSMGATRAQMLRKLVFPSSLSWVFNSLKLNVGVALLGAFIGEFISADRGIGFYMIKAGSLYDIPGVWAGAIYLVALAASLHCVVLTLEGRRLQIARFLSVERALR